MDIYKIRLKNLLDLINLEVSSTAFAKKVDTSPTYIHQITNPNIKGRIGSALARQTEIAYNKPEGWMDQVHRTNVNLLSEQSALETTPDYHQGNNNVRKHPGFKFQVPLITMVQVGVGGWLESINSFQPEDDKKMMETEAKVGPNAYALRVEGDSMAPEFPEGTTIIVDPDIKPKHGDYVIIRLDSKEHVTFKQLIIDSGRKYLKPFNERYPLIEVSKTDTFCGVIKEKQHRKIYD